MVFSFNFLNCHFAWYEIKMSQNCTVIKYISILFHFLTGTLLNLLRSHHATILPSHTDCNSIEFPPIRIHFVLIELGALLFSGVFSTVTLRVHATHFVFFFFCLFGVHVCKCVFACGLPLNNRLRNAECGSTNVIQIGETQIIRTNNQKLILESKQN